MGYLFINPETCIHDGLCVTECPPRIIHPTEGACAQVDEEDIARCIHCGHCVAICPMGALALPELKPEDCEDVNEMIFPTTENLQLLLRSRRSIRSYQDKVVERKQLEKMIATTAYAPSGHNLQPVHWTVVEGKENVKLLSECVIEWMLELLERVPEAAQGMSMDIMVRDWRRGMDRIGRGAPTLLVTHAPADALNAPTDCTIALSYFELLAFSAGLGACWAGYVHAAALLGSKMVKLLKLPEGHQVFGCMLLGYPRVKYCRIPKRIPNIIEWKDALDS